MSFDYSKLRGRIVEKFGTLKDFAEAIGVAPGTVTQKLSGERGFSQADIVKWCDALDLNLLDAPNYFLDKS